MKKFIRILLISIFVLTLILVVKNQFSSMLMKNASFGMVSLSEKEEMDNLFVGSSVFKQGLDVNQLRKVYGEDWYILAYNGNQPILMEEEINKVVESKTQINHLYVDMYTMVISQSPKLSDEKMLLELDITEKIRLYEKLYENFHIKEFWDMMVTSNNTILLTWPISFPMVNSQFDRGGTLVDSESRNETSLKEAYNTDSSFLMNDKQRTALINIVDVARFNNIDITFLEIPQYVPEGKCDIYAGLRQEYEKLLDGLSVDYVLADDIGFDNSCADYYQDIIHLSSAGREKYTEMLVAYLGMN